MKLIIALLFCTSATFAQVKAKGTDFQLKAGTVTWEKTYELPGRSAAAINETLLAGALTVFDEKKIPPSLSFDITNDKVRLKDFGAKPMSTSFLAQLYMNYHAEISVADGKYTVTLRNIYMDNKDSTQKKAGDISKFICTTSNVSFKTDETLMKGLGYVDQHFSNLFKLKSNTQ